MSLLLISNRLPITVKRSNDGTYDFSMSSGGLVTGLSGLSKSTTFHWFGWVGREIPEDEKPEFTKKLSDEYNAVPVFLSDDLADKHCTSLFSVPNRCKLWINANEKLQTMDSPVWLALFQSYIR